MSSQQKMQPVRGVRDIFGDSVIAFNHVLQVASHMATLHNYKELILPIFEFSDVFHRTLGESSDIVSKETYTFQDRDGSSITLRPEFTAPTVRSIISNGLTQSLPIKYFSHGALFRHERPQKARYRQFHQINCESIGTHEPYSDVEIIMLACGILSGLKLLDNLSLELSSIGDIESRGEYRKRLSEYLTKYESELSEDSKVRLSRNPLRILDSKDEMDRRILVDAPLIYDSFTTAAARRFEDVQIVLSEMNVKFTINPKLVRGLDYYTHTVFEFTTTQLGSQGTVLAGGRYDGLFELMGGPAIPAVGFAAGIERLAELAQGSLDVKPRTLVYIIAVGEKALMHCPKVAQSFRERGIAVDYNYHSSIGKQMQKADKAGATYAIIIGEEELKKGVIKLRNMRSGEEIVTTLAEVDI